MKEEIRFFSTPEFKVYHRTIVTCALLVHGMEASLPTVELRMEELQKNSYKSHLEPVPGYLCIGPQISTSWSCLNTDVYCNTVHNS